MGSFFLDIPSRLCQPKTNNTYTIKKLADGNVWMTENLRLINKTISSTGSNLPSGETYTVDYLSKKVRKNNGEKTIYEVQSSHNPIIQPDTFDRVQRELLRRRSARKRGADLSHPFANRLVCADCGAYFGHKVWRSGGKSGIRYNVWYCNRRYTSATKCETPTLREEEIKTAFVSVLKQLDYPEPECSDALWRELVESVTISADRKTTFLLTTGETVETYI